MVLEFCGLPGVGKSTIARALEERGFVKVRIKNKIELLFLNVVYGIRYPVAFLKVLFFVIQVSLVHGRFYPLFMNVFLDTNARIMKSRWTKGVAILDQSHIQGLLSLSYHDLSKEHVMNFLRFLPKPSHVFVFISSDEIRTKRLLERGYGPREHEVGRELWLSHIEHNIVTITKTISEWDQYPVSVISTQGATHEIVDTVVSQAHITSV